MVLIMNKSYSFHILFTDKSLCIISKRDSIFIFLLNRRVNAITFNYSSREKHIMTRKSPLVSDTMHSLPSPVKLESHHIIVRRKIQQKTNKEKVIL